MRYLLIIFILSISSFVYAGGYGINTRAADFEEDNSEFFTVSDSDSLSFTSSFTLAVDVKAESAVEDGARIQIFNKYAAGGQTSWLFDYRRDGSTRKLLCLASPATAGAGQTVITVTKDLGTGTWFRVLCVYDDAGDFIAIYVNGVEQGRTSPATDSVLAGTKDIEIGNNTADASQDPWDGLMDEAIIYDRALSFDEIQADYRNRGQRGVGAGVVGYWRFNEISGDRFDESPYGNTASDEATVTSTLDTAFKTVNGAIDF